MSSLFLSTVLMNLENNLAETSPLLFFSIGLSAWFGVYWAYCATREPLYARILAPLTLGLAVMGLHSAISTFFHILFILSIFLLKAMLHPIPFTIGLAAIGVARGVAFIQAKVREEVETAFQHIPPAFAAQLEQEQEQEQEQAESDHAQEEEEEENLNEAFVDNDEVNGSETMGESDGEGDVDDETIVGDQHVHEEIEQPDLHPLALPISPPSSPAPLQVPVQDYNVVEPLELIRPAGGAGDIEQHY